MKLHLTESQVWYEKSDGSNGWVYFDINDYMSVRDALKDITGDDFAEAFSQELYEVLYDKQIEKESLCEAIEEQVEYMESEQNDLAEYLSGGVNSIRDILNELSELVTNNKELSNKINDIFSKLDDVEECSESISGGLYELKEVLALYK